MISLAPRRVLVAPDKFKGTLSSAQAARAIVRGLRTVWPQTRFTTLAIADGGEGFTRTLTRALGGTLRRVWTSDALGRPCVAHWALLRDRQTAVLDLATASGLAQVPTTQRDPRKTSTLGTGRVLAHALRSGATTVIIGLGGSATNDGGIGLAAAMDWRFLDRHGKPIPLTGAGLLRLHHLEPPLVPPHGRIIGAVDVTNPLCGRLGAAQVFAPQKGAGPAAVQTLDAGLRRLAEVVERTTGCDAARAPGAGAAGGAGFGLVAFFGATLEPGFELLRRYLQIDAVIRDHDLVVTGEGRYDSTSRRGKAPFRLAERCAELGRPVWGVFGCIQPRMTRRPFARVAAALGSETPEPLEAARAVHERRLAAAAARLARESLQRRA
ncbi:MAG TPA: glycerate kinase [Candidatus Synoicihabitans sp.]|nr:glycerate kinase [Candidatus Synoicihabitans sp.]